MNIGIIAFSAGGSVLGESLDSCLLAAGHEAELFRCAAGTLANWTKTHFVSDNALIFIGAAGIAMRAVAPHIKSKTTDPAVIVIDEQGRFVIPLLSGHIGGANELAEDISVMLGALPVITTATDCRGVFAIDTWARKNKLHILNPERIKYVSARLLNGETVAYRSLFPVSGNLPDGLIENNRQYEVSISIKTKGNASALKLVPPVLTLGVGCRKGVPCCDLARAFDMILRKASFHKEAVTQVCSINLKAEEPGLQEFCRQYGLAFKTFSAEQLNTVRGHFSASEFVLKTTGTDNVCERSAVLQRRRTTHKKRCRKRHNNGVSNCTLYGAFQRGLIYG